MSVEADYPTEPEPAEEAAAATLAQRCGEEEFDHLVREMVAEQVPRLFAVEQVCGERVDGWVAVGGMAFEDRAEIVSVEGGRRMVLGSAERAAVAFARRPHVTARLVWVAPRSSEPINGPQAVTRPFR